MRFIVLLMLFLAGGTGAAVAADYDKLAAKAERFLQFQEWNSAHAMYILMINERQSEPKPYSRAIVMSGLMKDEQSQVNLLENTQKRGIPLDSIFSEVNSFSLEIGESQEYERFLRLVKCKQPWMARHINIRLLKYYDFRNDASNMVAVANELLAVTPNDVNYLLTAARGYLLLGDFDKGELAYRKILTIDSDNYDALLGLGNYYYVLWKTPNGNLSQVNDCKVNAIKYLRKAYDVNPTPFIAQTIKELSK